MRVRNLSGAEIIELVERAVKLFSLMPGMGHKNCGYFTLRDEMTGHVILLAQIGVCPYNKAAKYCTLSLEKGDRLFTDIDNPSSFGSRNPEAKVVLLCSSASYSWGHWGGAIRLGLGEGQLILSFSGLPELGDEAVVLAVAVQAGWLKGSQAKAIAKLSNNKYFLPLIEKFGVPPVNWWK
jgi:hypothetical protein